MEVIELGVVVVALTVLVAAFAIPLISSLGGSVSGSSSELWDGTVNVSHSLSFRPITTITTLDINATSKSYNKTVVVGGTGSQNLALLTPLRGNSANATLMVFYNVSEGESINVFVNGNLVGVLT